MRGVVSLACAALRVKPQGSAFRGHLRRCITERSEGLWCRFCGVSRGSLQAFCLSPDYCSGFESHPHAAATTNPEKMRRKLRMNSACRCTAEISKREEKKEKLCVVVC